MGHGEGQGAQLAGVPKEIGNDEYSDYGHNGTPYMFPHIYGMSHVVPGLYAAGRCTAGVAAWGYASGISLGDGSFYGRRAGRTAAKG